MLEKPEVIMHMQEAEKIAKKIDPHLYEVSFVNEVPHSWCQPWTRRIHNSSKKRPPVKSGGRTLLSITQVSRFQHVRLPQLERRRKR